MIKAHRGMMVLFLFTYLLSHRAPHDLKLTILLFQPLVHWDDRRKPDTKRLLTKEMANEQRKVLLCK